MTAFAPSAEHRPIQSKALTSNVNIGRKHRGHWDAGMLVLPLIAFLVMFLVVPLSGVLYRSVEDSEIATSLPRTVAALSGWDSNSLPPEAAYQALGEELTSLREANQLGLLARRIGYQVTGGRVLMTRTAQTIGRASAGSWKERFAAASPVWAQPTIWRVIQDHPRSISTFYLRWAIGLQQAVDLNGNPAPIGYDFPTIILRTLWIGVLVTALTVVLGYPLAYVISEAQGKTGTVLLLALLIPFWTSLLVRTLSWIVGLQSNGVINDVLLAVGVIDQPLRILYTLPATVIAMTQIQLPFTVLPILSVMKGIPKTHVRAARSLGAGPLRAHVDVFLPQAMPGIAGGALLTFILCLGFYITPALIGGQGDQLISYFIARFINEELNWGLAAALSVVLMLATAILAVPLSRLIGSNASGRL